MARRFAKVSEEEIVAINETAFFYPSDLVNTKTTIPPPGSVKSGGYISPRIASRYIHHYSPPPRGIVVYYSMKYEYEHKDFRNEENSGMFVG